ncbi:circadian clock protein KaiC, partial [Pseudomonas syringae pv. tagetis]
MEHSHGLSLDGIDLFEFSSTEEVLVDEYEQSILHPSEAELGDPKKLIQQRVDKIQPRRIE